MPSASTEPSASPSATPVPTPDTVPAPLTGLPVKPAIADRRVMVVMVDDQFDARPQSGLSGADVVWQAPAEGGIPRYMAFFQSGNPPAVGPVRSSRLYFISWASEWRPLYVHAGGSPQAKALLASAKGRGSYVYNADEFRWGGGRYLWRVNTRSAPHNVYTDGKHLRALAKRVGAGPVADQKPAWNFADPLPVEQRPTGGGLSVPYLANKVSYKYDRASNTYRRSVTGEKKQTDAGTKTRIAPTNVIVMAVRFAPLNDGSHKSRLEAQVTGSGKAWISTNGKTIRGTWKKPGFRGKTQFFDRNGQKVTLTRGQTFVQVVPLSAKITVTPGKAPVASTNVIAAAGGPMGAVGRFIS